MVLDIDKLLKKKTWTGEEIGKALIASFANDVRNIIDNKGKKPLLTQVDFNRMTDSLQTKEQIEVYLVYEKIYTGCVAGFSKGEGLLQQFLHGFYKTLVNLCRVYISIASCMRGEQFPLILSRAQYERILAEEQAKKREIKITFNCILFDYLKYCIANIAEAPEAIRKAIDACKKEAVRNRRVLDNYNADIEKCYHILNDRTDSCSDSNEEWQQVLQRTNGTTVDEINKNIISLELALRVKKCKSVFTGGEALDQTERNYNEIKKIIGNVKKISKENDISILEEIYLSILENPTTTIDVFSTNILEKVYRKLVNKQDTEWLSKYDIISEPDLLLRYYGGVNGDIPKGQQLEEFIADYPVLYNALTAEIRKVLKKHDYTQGELADIGFGFYPSYIEVTNKDIIDHYCSIGMEGKNRHRAKFRGIAVIPIGREDNNIDKDTGDYIEPLDYNSLFFGVDSIDDAMSIGGCMIPAAKYLIAYNVFLDILAVSYDIPDIEAGKIDLRKLENNVSLYNNLIHLVFCAISGNNEEQIRKRKLFNKYFTTIDLNILKPSTEAIEIVKKQLNDLGMGKKAANELKSYDNFINILMGGESNIEK